VHDGVVAGPVREEGADLPQLEDGRPGEWRSWPGFVELIENLAVARDNAEGMVHVILAAAQDKDAVPRSIARCFPPPKLKMRVIELDEAEGTFVLERVDS